ncbi:uncharacterized protein LOC109848453 isoform X2 [Asparagus officinalis]|uniref:uncharacterized protein LOC109848453 isoform X2 n=1 Tax=Asparagus officinalis TaxID=4686 RepID=UPI00098DF1D4|nr:uncharacterized protein LOC109848453 isoform X2 [Asparagus officinalis]
MPLDRQSLQPEMRSSAHRRSCSVPVGGGRGHRDPDPQFRGAYIVASFRVRKSISLLNANIMKLQYDIFEEIGIQNSLVTVISLEPLVGLNWTNVVFGIWPYPINTAISSTGLSIIRDNFMTFVIGRSSLHLTTSLFGKTYFFQVLKFPGGITITPEQRAFLLQKAGALFNFTLNFSIEKVQENLAELKAQMKSGLLLNPYENLYVSLTNIKGSTVAPPTVVQASVVLAVGNRPPSEPRLRQLAQTIRSDGNHGNLGLNHTVFGRVKQIQLSSSLKHSLNGGGNGISIPPSPAPQPQVDHHHHHHPYPHRHHHHHSNMDLAPAPTPQHMYKSPAPCGCHSAFPNKPKCNSHIVPAAAPVDSPKSSLTPAANEYPPALPPVEDPSAPSPVEDTPTPAPHSFHTPLPHFVLAHARAPSKSATETKPPDKLPAFSPSPSSSSMAGQPFAVSWVFVATLYLLAHF